MSDLNLGPFRIFFNLKDGSVGQFEKREIIDLVADTVKIDLELPKYVENNSGSAAKRLISFIKAESNEVVFTVIEEILRRWKEKYDSELAEKSMDFLTDIKSTDDKQISDYSKCIEALNKIKPTNIDLMQKFNNINIKDDYTIKKLKEVIKKDISEGEYDVLMDRLHTFSMHIFKDKCRNSNLTVNGKRYIKRYSRKIY